MAKPRKRKRKRRGKRMRHTARKRKRKRRGKRTRHTARTHQYKGRGARAAPTSFSVFQPQSPQLQKPGEYTKLTEFTTKNVGVQEGDKVYNSVIDGRLAYRRRARGQLVQGFPEILRGPPVTLLTRKNYKELTKGAKLYYDRGSVVFRGPFIFDKIIRGPELIFTVKDAGYKRQYAFSLEVNKLKQYKIYLITRGSRRSLRRRRRRNRPSHRRSRKGRTRRRKESSRRHHSRGRK